MRATLLIIVLAACMIAPLQAGQTDDLPVLSVCEVLHHPAKYNKHIVAIRGVDAGAGEGSWLTDDCPEHIKTVIGLEWPNRIWVGSKSNALGAVDFEVDNQAFEAMALQGRQQVKDPAHDRIWVTMIGRFETWDNLKVAVYRDLNGGKHLAGFGQGAGAPAQLIARTVKDIAVEHMKSPK